MGKKKELALELARVRTTHEQLLAENEALRAQLAAGDMAPPFRLVTDAKPSPIRTQIAEKLGIDLSSTAGVVTDEMILVAVERLRNPHHDDVDRMGVKDPIVVGKNDSLAEAIQHNRKERSDLLENVTQTRAVINRVAAALNVSHWNADGDEIIEKAQRFGVFHHWLRKRLIALESATTDNIAAALIDELRTIIVALIGEAALAKLVQNRPVKVTKTVLDLAETGAPTGELYLDRAFDRYDVEVIKGALERTSNIGTNVPRHGQLHLVFGQLVKSVAGGEEFANLMNALVLPILRKQHPAYQTAPKEN